MHVYYLGNLIRRLRLIGPQLVYQCRLLLTFRQHIILFKVSCHNGVIRDTGTQLDSVKTGICKVKELIIEEDPLTLGVNKSVRLGERDIIPK